MTADDRTLIRRLRGGDETALGSLLERHWEDVCRYAHGLLGDWDRAEDVAQHVFVRLWTRRERWEEDSSKSLLFRIARNRALDVKRARRPAASLASAERAVASVSPDVTLEAVEVERAARAAIAALPTRRREVFRLSREQGLSYGEIADVLDLSAQTVANHMSMALADLRVALRPVLEDDDVGGRDEEARTRPAETAGPAEGNR